MKALLLISFLSISPILIAQELACIDQSFKHQIESKHLNETRDYWVSLPLNYRDSLSYPVIYVLDAEWRFELIKELTFYLGADGKISRSIVIGIPHIDWENKRGKDLTFSQSRIEYDGEEVDSTWYNSSNSGKGMDFYNYLVEELIPEVNKNYSTSGHETLVGHSYGGYFGGYILSLAHPFEVMQIYDPSIWYSNGEVIERLKNSQANKLIKIHLTYQSQPEFHRTKIEEFIQELKKKEGVTLTTEFYKDETHNSLFLDSFYQGIRKTNGHQISLHQEF